ncbi:MAG: 30S ribosomal protein S1 [Planctomycetota bacterium]|nr:MAG: 30S ribosomal protein S1 [Planctomycetota bacterium]
MVDRNLIRDIEVTDEELAQVLGEEAQLLENDEQLEEVLSATAEDFDVNQIVKGKVVRVEDDEVMVDIGYKTEGVVLRSEWGEDEEPPKVGDEIEVLLEELEDELGVILLSKRKADRMREWERIIATHKEGDVVRGRVVRRIKGGLLVNIGVNVFLPASQVDIRRPRDIDEYVGQEIECVILKIDESRRNIVVSRRKLLEDRRAEMKRKLLEELEVGQVRKGVVKNFAPFGAFVDLGGIDGLLHVTDMSWGRIGHPSEMLKIDQEIEVKVIKIDREKEKIGLGLKQLQPSPWDNIEEKYPVGSIVEGEVVNIMPYGAFVKLEDGIEGLVHISEMSWTRRVNHPSDLVKVGDRVKVAVLGINKEKQEISLGMKQAEPNPWDAAKEKYPPGTRVKGRVRNLTNYGAFIELEEGIDGLLHVTDMSWTRKISHANELLKRGQEIECVVLNVDEKRRRIGLGLKQLEEDPWERRIPEQYAPGTVVKGRVTKLTNFGAFVEIEPDLEGLLHVSEMGDQRVNAPEDVVKPGQEVEVRILRIDPSERKIGLTMRSEVTTAEQAGEAASAAPKELKGGREGGGGPLFTLQSESVAASETSEPVSETAEAMEEAAVAAPVTEEASEPQPETAEPTATESAEAEAEQASSADESRPQTVGASEAESGATGDATSVAATAEAVESEPSAERETGEPVAEATSESETASTAEDQAAEAGPSAGDDASEGEKN